jgi:hypothetical protein
MQQSRSRGNAASILFPVATAAAAIAVFLADTATDVDIAFAVMYVVVVLMAARFLSARGVVLVAAGCVGLTVLSYLLTATTGRPFEGIINADQSWSDPFDGRSRRAGPKGRCDIAGAGQPPRPDA